MRDGWSVPTYFRQQVIKRAGGDPWDGRSWVPARGGYGYGNEGHHHLFDISRTLRLPRAVLPAGVEELALEPLVVAERTGERLLGEGQAKFRVVSELHHEHTESG